MKSNILTSTIVHKQAFPFIQAFGDYHEIDTQLANFKKNGFKSIKAKEIAYDGRFWGVFYQNTIPSPCELVKELKKLKFQDGAYSTFHKTLQPFIK